MEELNEEQQKQLASWIKGLFDTDGIGITDEVTSSCRPQQFYMLVPTLFSQTVYACTEGILGMEAVKGGLECKYPTW
jgi:mediator of RNA polymerase II transcription subunit 5